LNKKVVAWKLLTNRKIRQGTVELLKNLPIDKRTLVWKLLTNRKMRRGTVELLKDPHTRSMVLQQATQRLRRS
jgi:hypothetical protein